MVSVLETRAISKKLLDLIDKLVKIFGKNSHTLGHHINELLFSVRKKD
jgi:hypothetical protein